MDHAAGVSPRGPLDAPARIKLGAVTSLAHVFDVAGLVRRPVPGDGYCFYHALAAGFGCAWTDVKRGLQSARRADGLQSPPSSPQSAPYAHWGDMSDLPLVAEWARRPIVLFYWDPRDARLGAGLFGSAFSVRGVDPVIVVLDRNHFDAATVVDRARFRACLAEIPRL